jgi:ribonuclease HI
MKKIELFTDGAAKGNPGNGGYGVLLRFNGKVKELSEGFRLTTNNRMELLAVIVGLEALKKNEYPVHVYSDSKYVIDSITKGWVYGWYSKGFKGKKNKDLWLRFLNVSKQFKIEYHWVKGHAGHPENERCDQLAVEASLGKSLKIDEVFEQEKSREKEDLF